MKKQNGENRNYVLDSTAFLALFEDEPGAETVQKLLERAKKGEIVISANPVQAGKEKCHVHIPGCPQTKDDMLRYL